MLAVTQLEKQSMPSTAQLSSGSIGAVAVATWNKPDVAVSEPWQTCTATSALREPRERAGDVAIHLSEL